MEEITRREEMIMLAVLNLKENAYLIGVKNYISKITGKKASLSSIHIPLRRLEKRGLLNSEFGEAEAVRGGRRKKIYSISKHGFEILNAHKKINDILWVKYPGLEGQQD